MSKLKMLSGLAALIVPGQKPWVGPMWRAPHSALPSMLGRCHCRHCRTARGDREVRALIRATARRQELTRREFLTGTGPR